jgi:hypothetical protein
MAMSRGKPVRSIRAVAFLLLAIPALLVPVAQKSFAARQMHVEMCDTPGIDCLDVDVGDELHLGIFIENTPELNFTYASFDLILPEGLTATSYSLNPHIISHSLGENGLPNSVTWSESDCPKSSVARVMSLELRVDAPVVNEAVRIENVVLTLCLYSPGRRFAISGDAFEINPLEHCSSLRSDVEYSPEAVVLTLLSDRYTFRDILLENNMGIDLQYEARFLDTGDGTDWLYVVPYSFVPHGGSVTVRVKINSASLPRGVYRSILELGVTSSCLEPFLIRVPIQLTILGGPEPEGMIALTFDPEQFDCDLDVAMGDIANIYVVAYMNQTMSVAAAEYSLEIPEGVELLAESYGDRVTVTNGELVPGIQMAFDACEDDYLVLARARFYVGAEVSAAKFRVVPHPESSFLGFARCDPDRTLTPAEGGEAVLNGVCDQRVPTKEKTWGSIKALYRTSE